jgi:serine/threonine-protein kinase
VRALASLTGTAAVRVFDQQWTDDGALCLVMELLHGRDFEMYLRSLESAGQRLDLPLLFRLLGPIVDTLEIAHDQGILHRDLKPPNIFVQEPLGTGGVKLLDFGFAKFVRLKSVTAAGFVAGSPSYIAPESWRGDPDAVDRRIDVYGLAAVIFRALAGRPPFVSDDLRELLRLATSGPRPSLHAIRPDLPQEIDDWVHQALAIDPADRFFRVRALWNAFHEAVGYAG